MQKASVRSPVVGAASRRPAAMGLAFALLMGLHAIPAGGTHVDPEDQHLLVSEVMTGGAGAADEFIEITNPGPEPLPLEGLEVVYLSATGTTPATRAAWPAGAASVPPGGHVLIANSGGLFAPIADALYAAGIAATGGSVALRIQGASSPIDAVGWGTASNAWMEGRAAPAPQAGSSLERLPGGGLGSTQDTGDNLADFAERTPPDPQNSTSPPTPPASPPPTISPTPTPEGEATPIQAPTASPEGTAPASSAPTAIPTPTPTVTVAPSATPSPSAAATPTLTPTPTPGPSLTPIAQARALPDGSVATVAGVALTASDFADGGGYVADASGGIAVLVTGGAFGSGDAVIASGELDDRFAQRTLRVDGPDLTVAGAATEPTPHAAATGAIGESVEGRLVAVAGAVDGAPTPLSGGLAFDLDDGSGAARVLVFDTTGIDVDGWTDGATIDLVGVVGQRDSSGTGTTGYRVQPRAPTDVRAVVAPTASPSAEASPGTSSAPASPGADGDVPLVTIAEARAAQPNARLRVRGVATLPSGLVEAGSAVVQDATGAILLRLGDEAGGLDRGQQVEASGTRSTKGGMLTLRVSEPLLRLAGAPEPGSGGTGHRRRG